MLIPSAVVSRSAWMIDIGSNHPFEGCRRHRGGETL
jgi:hypothetical protein